MLNLEAVRLFTLVVDLGNLTRAAEAAGTVQPVVSQRLRQLEVAIGRRLLERTPRFVRLTPEGAAFLPRARHLLAAHDEAAAFQNEAGTRFALGASDHAVGAGLEQILRVVRATLPSTALVEVRMGMSQDLRTLFDTGVLDAAITRREMGGADGESLGYDPLGWRASPDLKLGIDQPVPLATLGPPCGVRAAATRALDAVGRPWRDVFTGGSCTALLAAAHAGIGIAPMGTAASGRLADRGQELGLPALPASEIVLYARAGSGSTAKAVRGLERAVRTMLH